MNREQPYDAVICDMDGVLTRTAELHRRAFKATLDEYLRSTKKATGPGACCPFTDDDYRRHVDGKSRYQAVADFLAARSIELPWGAASDPPGRETICGLGNRKERWFQQMLEEQGVQVHPDAAAALARWCRGQLRCAVVSTDLDAEPVLDAAGLRGQIEVVLDARRAAALGLRSKRELLVRAAEELGVDPADAVVLEGGAVGVRAAREAELGLVIGVDHDGAHRRHLEEAGAHEVVSNVFALRFRRQLPSALEHRGSLRAWRGDRSLAVFLDYDGTLSPIVEDPASAVLSPEQRALVEALAERCPVAIVSGRDRPDVEARVALPDLLYAGSHGLDIAGRGLERTFPEAEEAIPEVNRVHGQLRRTVGSIDGVILERKRFSLAVHHRRVGDPELVEAVRQSVDCVLHTTTCLRKRLGKQVIELEPDVDWDKGRAVRWMLEVLELDPSRTFVVYVGDDETDEDAFAALAGLGAGIRVGLPLTRSLADYHLRDPEQVGELLRWLQSTLDDA